MGYLRTADADELTQQLGATLRISEEPEQELPPLQQLLKLCGQPVCPDLSLLLGTLSCPKSGWPLVAMPHSTSAGFLCVACKRCCMHHLSGVSWSSAKPLHRSDAMHVLETEKSGYLSVVAL